MSSADLQDWAGTLHERAASGARLASLVPSITELLFALGLGPSLVARTGFCVHPHPHVRGVSKVGGTKDPDLARLAKLQPTHLVVNVDENRREVVAAARAFVPHVIVTHPQALDENPRLYRLLGAIFAREQEALALCEAYAAARAALMARVRDLPRERVLYLIWRKPWMTVSRETYIADALALAGWDIVTPPGSAARYPVVEEDDPAWSLAERILLSTEPYAFVRRDVDALTLAKGRPVHLVDGEMTSWYGPRAITGMAYLGALHAEIAGSQPARGARARRR